MNHAQVVAYLESAARAAGAASFWHGARANGNINYNAPFPQALLYHLPSKLTPRGIEYQVALCFVGKDEHENGGPDSVAITNAMDTVTQKLYFQILLEDDALTVENMERAPVQRQGAAIGTGYLVTFVLIVPRVC